MATLSPGVFVERAIGWVRSAYPEGVPTADRMGLIRVLNERLTQEEMDALVRALPDVIGYGPDQQESRRAKDLRARFAANVTPIDRYRVAGRLAAGGWPLADIA